MPAPLQVLLIAGRLSLFLHLSTKARNEVAKGRRLGVRNRAKLRLDITGQSGQSNEHL